MSLSILFTMWESIIKPNLVTALYWLFELLESPFLKKNTYMYIWTLDPCNHPPYYQTTQANKRNDKRICNVYDLDRFDDQDPHGKYRKRASIIRG